MSYLRLTAGALLVAGTVYVVSCKSNPVGVVVAPDGGGAPVAAGTPVEAAYTPPGDSSPETEPVATTPPAPLPACVHRGLDWLCGAQQQDGGWGAGSHAHQNVRDAHAVPTDPATTAVAAIALIRSGSGIDHGAFAEQLAKATTYLLDTVDKAPDGPQITALTGTQPQAKMGKNVDTALAAQFFARLLQDLDATAELRPRVEDALDVCLGKIQSSQAQDGSWKAGGWAPVLQSAQMCTALELGQLVGRQVDEARLARARDYQRGQVTAGTTGTDVRAAGGAMLMESASVARFAPSTDAAAGVQLYSSAANARAVVAEAKAAEEIVEQAKKDGKLAADVTVSQGILSSLGVPDERAEAMAQSVAMNDAAKVRAFDENVLNGFGNNGGEEFLSYQMKSEALVIDGGEEFPKWREKMIDRLGKVQNQDGSWTGHHCITSPTFCTATAISCLTAERDVDWLRKASALAAK